MSSLTMTRAKQQHFVPQAYLRRFADLQHRIHVFDKLTLREFVTHVRNIAAEQGFYDASRLPASSASTQSIETDFLPSLEREGNAALTALLTSIASGTFRCLRGRRRGQLARYMALQALRTREYRESTVAMAGLMQEVALRAHLEATHPELANARFRMVLPPEGQRALHAEQLLDPRFLEGITSRLLGHTWLVLRAPEGTPFWTSDDPVTRRGHLTDPVVTHTGFGSPGIEIAFPVSPSVLILLFDSVMFETLSGMAGSMVAASPDNVTYYNAEQVFQSWRYVYSPSGSFELAGRVCLDNPDLRRPDRQRVEVLGSPWTSLRDRVTPEHLPGVIRKPGAGPND